MFFKKERRTNPTPGHERTALEEAHLNGGIKGRVFVITGGYNGIGEETTKALLHEGGQVVIGGRNPTRLKEFTEEMKDIYEEDCVDSHILDLSDLTSVKAFAKYVLEKYEFVHVLINNAGVMKPPPGLTKDGFEKHMGVNVIGPFLLSKLLEEKTKRQVWVSSMAHFIYNGERIDIDFIKRKEEYKGWHGYQQSKLGCILLAKEFARRGLEAASLHPGIVQTEVTRHTNVLELTGYVITHLPKIAKHTKTINWRSLAAGAATTITAATLPSDLFVNGGYYEDCSISKESEAAKNASDAKALYELCDEVTKAYQ